MLINFIYNYDTIDFVSIESQYISLFSNPMALLRATAAIILIILLVQN